MAKLRITSGLGSSSDVESKHASMSAYMPAPVTQAQAKVRSSSHSHSAKRFHTEILQPQLTVRPESEFESGSGPVRVQVFGSAAIDITTRPDIALQPGTTTPGTIRLTPGGVGRNIAEAAQNLLARGAVQLVSTIGSGSGSGNDVLDSTSSSGGDVDGFGKVLLLEMQSSGLRTDGLQVKDGGRTAGCTLSLGVDGDLSDGVADMSIIESLSPEIVSLSPLLLAPLQFLTSSSSCLGHSVPR